ncbi:MAG: mechanosensitive ion channel family protein [Alphaproteobacteria bacterium]|nr:mechanosensitive ion channel family protein [Alphaproteobacteria bacterium]
MRGWFLALAMGLLTVLSNPTVAQDTSETESTLQEIVERAQADGYQIVLVPQPTEEAEAASGGDIITATAAFERRARQARERLDTIIGETDKFGAHMLDVLEKRAGPDGDPLWILYAFGLAALFLTIGHLVGIPFYRWMRLRFANLYHPEPETRTEKLVYPIQRVLLRGLNVLVQCGIAAVLVVAFGDPSPPWRTTMMLTVVFFGVARLAVVVFEGMINPEAPNHRLIQMSDADARGLYGGFKAAAYIAAPVGGLCVLMDLMGIDRDGHVLMLIVSTLVSALLFSGLAIRYRSAVAEAIVGHRPDEASAWLKIFASSWHGLAVVYFMGAWFTTAIRLLLEQPGALGLIMSPIQFGVLAFYIYGIGLILLDRFVDDPRTDDGEQVQGQTLKSLLEDVFRITLLIGTLALIVQDWFAVKLDDHPIYDSMVEIAVIGLLGYVAFKAAKLKIDSMIREEGGDEAALPGDEGGHGGASRIATLLPILRNFILAVIVTIAGMVILSEMGLDIAPLFAGAGVVGLAVGFGAQTLIRDIFSGAFFLVDDAFRKGEYIETNGTRGTVEKISVRSMQLRHHLGPLHTIPFGEITSLTNYSRDWVIMKLPLRLTYDTDPEKVRKLIKKLGQQLLEHPDIGQNFIEPLKAQGVRQMEDSAMIFSVKFMTKPGDQFTARKVIFAEIRKLFEENGIRFANREVTVRLADETAQNLSKENKEAIAGAVAPVLDEADAQQAASQEAKNDAR